MELETEKLKDSLTLKEQQQMLDDLFLMEALVVAHREYAKSIGKLDECIKFVGKFMSELTNEKARKYLNEVKA